MGGFLFIIMNCFVLSSLLSLSLAAPAPEAAAIAEAAPGYPLLAHHVAPLAVVTLKQLQWPGVSAPGVDTTCFGCRAQALVPIVRGRRSADAVAEANAEAEAEAYFPLSAGAYYPYAPVPAVALHSYAGVNHAGVAYNTGLHATHVLPLGRRRREAEAEADPEADADAYYTALNGYAHNLGSGHSFAAISSGPALPHGYGVAAYPAAYGYQHHHLG